MLFRKKMSHYCGYCQHGTAMGEDQVLCCKRGVVSVDHNCRKFRYDPCKRTPPKMKALDFNKYQDTDFSL